MIIKSLAMEEMALLMLPPISNLWEWGLEYQSPSALPLLAQVLIRIVAIKDYLLLRWKCSYSSNHTPPISWAEFHPPTSITSRCQTSDSEHSPYLGETLVKGRRIQQAYYYRMYFVHNFSLFIYEGKKIILRVEGTDTLHQMIISKEDGFIPIIVGASLLAYFLCVLCSRLVNG